MDENKEQPNKEGKIKNVRTYMSDMADTVRANEISVIKVALAEQNKRAREDLYREAEGTPVKKIFWILGGVILIAGAIYGSMFLLKEKAKITAPEKIITREVSIVSYDEVSSIDVSNEENLADKINRVKRELNTTDNKESLKLISLVKEVNGLKEKIGVEEFFDKLGFRAPSSLMRSLSDSYMIGTYTKNETSLFVILQSKDYEYTYAGMLSWEETMAGDMFDLFELKTEENKIEINNREWKDVVMENKDSRILFNEEQKPILYYMFADRENVVITDSKDAIKEITTRLIMKNIKPL